MVKRSTHSLPQQDASAGRQLPALATLVLLAELFLLVRLIVFQRRREDFVTVDTYAFAEIAIAAVVVLLLILQPGRLWRLWQRLSRTSGSFLLGFFVLAIASAAWSSLPRYSAFRAGEFAALSIGLLVILGAAGSFRQAEKLLLFQCVCALAFPVVKILVMGGGGSSESFRSNATGAGAAMLACYGAGEMLRGGRREGRWRLWVATVVGITLAFLSWSLASWWSLLMGSAVAFLLSKSGRGFLAILVITLGLGAALAGTQFLEPVVDPHGEIEKVDTFTGRKILWEAYAEVFKEKPWLGVGYAVAARVAGPMYATNTHNAAWAVALGTGLIGLMIVFLAALWGLGEALSACNAGRAGAVGTTAALVAGAANGMSISSFGETWGVAAFVLMLFVAFHLSAVVRPQWADRVEPGAKPAPSRRRYWKTRSRRGKRPAASRAAEPLPAPPAS